MIQGCVVSHSDCNATLVRELLFLLGESVEALDDDEHVVDADPEEEEGEDAVHGAEHEAAEGADSVGDADAHDHAEDAGEGEVGALLHAVEPAEVGQDEGEDHHVAHAEHCLRKKGIMNRNSFNNGNLHNRGEVYVYVHSRENG